MYYKNQSHKNSPQLVLSLQVSISTLMWYTLPYTRPDMIIRCIEHKISDNNNVCRLLGEL